MNMNLRRSLTIAGVLTGAAFLALGTGVSRAAEPAACIGNCYVQDKPPLIHRTFNRRIQIEQGVYEIAREPSLYGWTRHKVRRAVTWHETPAVYKTVEVRKRIPSRHVWEKRLIKGREVMCKVRVPGKTVTVEKKVLVSPARRVAAHDGPAYDYVERRVLLRPYKNIAIYHPARHIYTAERVAVQPEGRVWRKARKSDLLWD